MAQGGNEKVCPTCPPRSFNKHNDVMGSSFFTALGFLFSAEQLSFSVEPKLPINPPTDRLLGHSLSAALKDRRV